MVRKGVKIGPLRVEPHKGLGGKRFGEGPTGVKVPVGAKKIPPFKKKYF